MLVSITSCYYLNNRRIFYHQIFESPPKDLTNAILRVVPKTNLEEIREFIDSISEISDVRKTYLKRALGLRYNQILAPALRRSLGKHHTANVIKNEDQDDDLILEQ
jgi:hypothetical protein